MMRWWPVKKASFSELKKFITETKLEYRPPYASSDRRLPKSFIIVRATNDHDYLNDLTGERRFLVAEVHKDNSYKGRKWTEKDRRAFWGAMVVAWKSNKSLTLTDEQEKLVMMLEVVTSLLMKPLRIWNVI